MILEMYINNILIDRAEIFFMPGQTLKQREKEVKDMKAYLYRENFDHSFVSKQDPSFFLVASSKANDLIYEDRDKNILLRELDDELLTLKTAENICR